jgi:hypothetical protein
VTPARVLVAGLAWRLLGTRRSGAALLNAFTTADEQNRMLAGMSLVRAGARSFDLIEREIEQGDAAASLVRLLPDIDDKRSRSTLERLASGDDEELADAARQCLAAMQRQESLDQDAIE